MPFFDRRSPRLPRFDYRSPAAYFITVVIHRRQYLLGDIVSGRSIASEAGHMVTDTWHSLPARYPVIALDTFVVMPNHVHGILGLHSAGGHERRVAMPDIVGAFKSLTTVRYIHGIRTRGWPSFDRRLWQRSYYDRVIRDDAELSAYRDYIETNPSRWTLDREFPNRPT